MKIINIVLDKTKVYLKIVLKDIIVYLLINKILINNRLKLTEKHFKFIILIFIN